jgi:hypothetical protein
VFSPHWAALGHVFDQVLVVDVLDSGDQAHLSWLGQPELGGHFHQAPLLDPHPIQQMCVPGCRHTRECTEIFRDTTCPSYKHPLNHQFVLKPRQQTLHCQSLVFTRKSILMFELCNYVSVTNMDPNIVIER